MSSETTEIRARVARDLCRQHGHAYHPTWEMGHVVCTVCGTRAVCPVCVPQWPDTKLSLHVCDKHQPKEKTA